MDGRVRLLDRDGAQRWQGEAARGYITSVAFPPSEATPGGGSDDGRGWLAAEHDDAILLRDLATGAELLRLAGHGGGNNVWSLAFADGPDGLLLASGADDNTIRLWDPRAALAAAATSAGSASPRVLAGHPMTVRSVAFSPDPRAAPGGLLLASGSDDRTVRLWDCATGRELRRLQGHSDVVWSVAFAPNPHRPLLASGSHDRTIRLWDPHSGRALRVLTGHEHLVLSVAFAPGTGRPILASGSTDKTVRLWDADTGRELQRLDAHEDWVNSVAFAPDGTLASVSDDGSVCLWDCTDLVQPARPAAPRGEASLAHWLARQARTVGRAPAPDPEPAPPPPWVPTGLPNDTTPGSLGRLGGGTGDDRVSSVALSPDGRRAYSGDLGGRLRAWDLADGRLLWETRAHERWITDLLLDPNLGLLSCSGDRIRIQDPAGGAEVRRMTGHDDLVWSIALRPGDATAPALLASASQDGTVRLWDPRAGREVARLAGHGGGALTVAFSADGRLLASGGRDHSVRLWDPDRGGALGVLAGHADDVWSVAFAPRRGPAAGLLASAGANADPSIRLWADLPGPGAGAQTGPGREVRRLTGHTGAVLCLRFSPDGHRLASASGDRTVRVWDPATGAELHRFRFKLGYYGRRLAWSPDGAFLAAACLEDGLRLWDTRDSLPASAASPGRPTRLAPTLQRGSKGGRSSVPSAAGEVMAPEPATTGAGASRPEAAATSPPTAAPTVIPAALAPLPRLWSALHRLGIDCPLSLLADLHALLSGRLPPGAEADGPLAPVAAHPGLARLRALRWPGGAWPALIALLLSNRDGPWPGGAAWAPPTEPPEPPNRGVAAGSRSHGEADDTLALAPSQLAERLHAALCAPAVPTAAPPPPVGFLLPALAAVDERLLALLAALGPRALAADPGLVLRLRHRIGHLPALAAPQRRLLATRIAPVEAGPAQGGGAGFDRAGLASRGPVTALLPSQLALPPALLLHRHLNGGLLYRARTGREPPRLRPTLILLDTGPACYGPVEALTRPGAYALAETLAQRRIPAVLLGTGAHQLHLLDHPAGRLEILTARTLEPADPAACLTKARALLAGLDGDALAPIVLLLTHCFFAAEAERLPAVPGLRALFVRYPPRRGQAATAGGDRTQCTRPAFARHCEHWECLGHDELARVAAAIGRLIA